MWSWTLAQDAGGGLPDLGVFGVSGATIGMLIYFLLRLYKDKEDLRKEFVQSQASTIERLAEVTVKANAELGESAQALEAATVMMHQLAGRPGISPEQIFEITRLLREFRPPGNA